MSSGETYRAARLAVTPHLSQERLALEAGISRRQYIRIEQGHSRPGERTRALIAAVLGVDPDSLPVREAVNGETPRLRMRRITVARMPGLAVER